MCDLSEVMHNISERCHIGSKYKRFHSPDLGEVAYNTSNLTLNYQNMEEALHSIDELSRLLEDKKRSSGYDYADTLIVLVMTLLKLEIHNFKHITGQSYNATVYLSGYSYQSYMHSFPLLHQKLLALDEMLYPYQNCEYLGDIDTPIISDREGWCKYLSKSIENLLLNAQKL